MTIKSYELSLIFIIRRFLFAYWLFNETGMEVASTDPIPPTTFLNRNFDR